MKKTLLLSMIFACSTNIAIAGIPVLDEASSAFLPLTLLEELNTQLNTLQTYEQMIIDYENQVRQLENIAKNTRFDKFQISSIRDLRAKLTTLKTDYKRYVDTYNQTANRINELERQGCDFMEWQSCGSNHQEELEKYIAIAKENNEQLKNNFDISKEGSIAYNIELDRQKIENLSSNASSRSEEGSNQILADSRELTQLTNEQLVALRGQLNNIHGEQLKNNEQKAEDKAKHQRYVKQQLSDSGKWKNKVYKDSL